MATRPWHFAHARMPACPRPPRRRSSPPSSSSARGGFGADYPPAPGTEAERSRPGQTPTRGSTQSIQSTLSSQSRTDASASPRRTPPRPRSRPSASSLRGDGGAPQPSVEAAHTFPPSQQLRNRISEVSAGRHKTLSQLSQPIELLQLSSTVGKHTHRSRCHHSRAEGSQH
jgi:hypothetical protein